MLRNILRKYLFKSDVLISFVAITLFILAGFINIKTNRPVLELSKQDTAVNINKNLLIFISAGNKRLFTDLLWVQTLIESDIEHYKKRDLNNWLFLRFITIATLDERFYENYLFGGQFLAIVKDDLEGADKLYDKGLLVFPNDYKLNYGSGFLNYYEIGNAQKGIKFLEKIKNNPEAPTFLPSIINKLKLENGIRIEEIFKFVLNDYEKAIDLTLKNRLRRDLYALKAEIDLKCLNNKKDNCDDTDLEGNKYIKKNNSYFSKKLFLKYRIRRGEDFKSSPQNYRINYIK